MFIHNFKYAIKTLFRDRMLIFWTYAFPIILGAFFWLAFSDIEKNEQLDIIDIAIVDSDEFEENMIWKYAFSTLGDAESEDALFDIQYVSEDEAKELLADQEISGYFVLEEDTPKIVVASDGIEETVLKYVTEEVSRMEKMVENIVEFELEKGIPSADEMEAFGERIYEKAQEMMEDESAITDVSGENLSYTMIEFYTLIAMTCLYGGILGMAAVNQNLANMSDKGKRVSVSPVSKGSLIGGSVLAGYITQLIGIAILFAFTIFVLKVDYGERLFLIVLLTLCGCLAGLSLGIAAAVLIKANDGVKTGVIISLTMVGCFLSGMMGITMKYVVDKNIPILNRVNPANMITDGLYALYYYDTLERYWTNVVSLLIFSLVMILASISGLRRQRYDSI